MNFTPQLPHSAPEQLNATRENHTSVRQDSWSIQGHQSQEILNTPSIKKYLQSGETCKEGPGDSEMNALDTGKGTSEGTKQIHQCRREPDKKSTLEAKRRENFNEVWLPLPFVSKPLFFFFKIFVLFIWEREWAHKRGWRAVSKTLLFRRCWVAVRESLPRATLLMTTLLWMKRQIILETIGVCKCVGEVRLLLPHLAQRNLPYLPQENIGRIWMGRKQRYYFNSNECTRSKLTLFSMRNIVTMNKS